MRTKRLYPFAVTTGLLMLAAVPASSLADMIRMGPFELSDRCEHAVVGTVLDVRSAWNAEHTKIFTTIEIAVSENLKGDVSPGGVLTLVELGGTADETTMVVEHAPTFEAGDRVLVFTEYTPDGRLIVLGRDQGKLRLSDPPTERDAMTGLPLHPEQGQIAHRAGAEDFLATVRAELAKRGYQQIRREPTESPSRSLEPDTIDSFAMGGAEGATDEQTARTDAGSVSEAAPNRLRERFDEAAVSESAGDEPTARIDDRDVSETAPEQPGERTNCNADFEPALAVGAAQTGDDDVSEQPFDERREPAGEGCASEAAPEEPSELADEGSADWMAEELASWMNDPGRIDVANDAPAESWGAHTGMYSCFHANRWSPHGVYYPYAPDDEVFQFRTRHSKTFDNHDGTYTAVFLSDLHYEDSEGRWRDVDLSLTPNDTGRNSAHGLCNLTNHFETFVDDGAGNNGVVFAWNDQTIRVMHSSRLEVVRADGTLADAIQRSPATTGRLADDRIVTYADPYPEVSDEVVMLKRGVEHGSLVRSATWLAGSPGGELVFVEHVDLPAGWQVIADGAGRSDDFVATEFTLLPPDGQGGVRYCPVTVFDGVHDRDEILSQAEIPPTVVAGEKDAPTSKANDFHKAEYRVRFVDGGLEVGYGVAIDWLLDKGRRFPVYVDPTVEILTGYAQSSQTNWGMPYNTYYHDQRYDFLVLASDLTSAGVTGGSTITGMSMYCSAAGGMNLSAFYIRTQATSATTLTAWATSGWTVNFGPYAHPTPAAETWYDYTFSTNYSFNGTSNMLVNVSRDNTSWSGSGGNYCRGTIASRAGYGYSDSDYAWPHDGMGFNSFSYLPSMKITYTAPAEHCYTPPTYDYTITPSTSWQTTGSISVGATGCRIYRLSLCPSYGYDFSMCVNDGVGGSAPTGDADLTMYDSAGTSLWYIDGPSSCGYDATTLGTGYQNWVPPSAGYYYLKVSEYYSSALTYNLAYRSTALDPCASATLIGGCGAGYTQTYSSACGGVWDVTNCGYSTPGQEKIYYFVAPTTGTYSIQVTSGGCWVDYFWQASSCGSTGWNCIDDIYSPGTYGSTSWTAGTTYYILLDAEGTSSCSHQFYINCPTPAPAITGVSPNHAPAGVGSAGPAGSLVTVTGTNFGATQGSSVIAFWASGSSYNYNNGYVVSWSDTTIQCYVPAGCSSKDVAVYRDFTTWSNFYPFTVDWSFWYRWQDASVMPIPYYINQNGTADVSDEFAAVQAGIQTWENISNCYADHRYIGTTGLTATNNDGTNVVSWTESGWSHGSGVIGVSTIWLNSGLIIETDLEINGQEFTYTTSGIVAGQVDVQNLVTHEAGHGYVGLSDLYGTPDVDKTMFGQLDVANGEDKKRTLDATDIAGAAWIYPHTTTAGLWSGNYDVNWFDWRNWDDGAVPTSGQNVTIPAGRYNYPNVATSDALCHDLTISAGANVTVAGGNVNIGNDVYVYGTLGMGSGNVNPGYSAGWYGDVFFYSGSALNMTGGVLNFENGLTFNSGMTLSATGGTIRAYRYGDYASSAAFTVGVPNAGIYGLTVDQNVNLGGSGGLNVTGYTTVDETFKLAVANFTCSTQYLNLNAGGEIEVNAGGVFTRSSSGGYSGLIDIHGGTFNANGDYQDQWTGAQLAVDGGTYNSPGTVWSAYVDVSMSSGTIDVGHDMYLYPETLFNVTGGTINCAGGWNPNGGVVAAPYTIGALLCFDGATDAGFFGGVSAAFTNVVVDKASKGEQARGRAREELPPEKLAEQIDEPEGRDRASQLALADDLYVSTGLWVKSGSTLVVPAGLMVSHAGGGTYAFTVDGTLSANSATFEYTNASGVDVSSTGTLTDLSGCTFQNGASGGALLTVANAQTLSAAGTAWYLGNASYNVKKSGSSGSLSLCGATGAGAGPAYEYDPYGKVHWDPVAPTSAASDRSGFCADDAGNIQLTASGGSGDTVRWYSGGCGGSSVGTGNPLILASPTQTTTYYASWENTCGSSSCASVTVTVYPLPSTPTNGQVNPAWICPGEPANISASVGGGEAIDWYTGSCGGTFVGTGNPLSVNPSATTTYYGVARNTSSGCESAACVSVQVPVDTGHPWFTYQPPHVTQNADAGDCSAIVSISAATASDDYDAGVDVTYERTDNPAWTLSDPFPTGTTVVTWTAADACGHETTYHQNVTIEPYNDLILDVELLDVSEPWLTRCLTFELFDCDGTSDTFTQEITFDEGLAGAVPLTIACGDYDCIVVRDALHTLARRLDRGAGLNIVSADYVGSFTGTSNALIGGDLSDDHWIDIMDFVYYVNRWGTNYGSGNTSCPPSGIHADISGDGLVATADFSFIQTYFLTAGEDDCCGTLREDGSDGPRTAISVEELFDLGLGYLADADLNGDGMIDAIDVAAFADGDRPPTSPDSMDPLSPNVSGSTPWGGEE